MGQAYRVASRLNGVRREDHALATVTSLRAEHPDRGRVVHLDGVRGEAVGLVVGNGHAKGRY